MPSRQRVVGLCDRQPGVYVFHLFLLIDIIKPIITILFIL
jgi:hypothetical protein